jgi:hypothetical protein
MVSRVKSNRTCLLASRGFASCDQTEGGKKFQGTMEVLFDSLPMHPYRHLRRVPLFIAGYRPEFAAALTVVFDPCTGDVWFKPEKLDLSFPPFCFRDMTAIAGTYSRLLLTNRKP